MLVRSIKEMKAKMKAKKISISAMKARFDIETDDPVTDDAVYSFSGCKEKKEAKKRKTKHDSDE